MKRRVRLVAFLSAALALGSCADAETAAPRCNGSPQRAGVVAQAVPTAAFVPCIATLPPGWTVRSFEVQRGHADLALESDRAEHKVDVRLARSCDVRGATPVTPHDEGVRSYLRVGAISPRYAGRILDVFPGGCVTYDFNFERGPHIALLDELNAALDLYPRQQLRRVLRDDIGVTLDP